MSEDDATKKLQEFGYQLKDKSEEYNVFWYRKKAGNNTTMLFEIDPKRGMYAKALFVEEVYNGTDIDEIFETHIKKFLNAANMDLEESRIEPEFDNYRRIYFYNLEDDRYSGSVIAQINQGRVTIEYSMFMREKTER